MNILYRMKKCSCLFILMLFFVIEASANGHNTLVVEINDGSCVNFPLAEKPRVTFLNDYVKIVTPTADIEFLRSDVRKCYFKDVETAIETIESPRTIINDEIITVCDIPDNTTVTVCNASGMALMQSIAVGGMCTFSMESLPSGLYIVTYNNTGIKFLKK